MRILQLGKFYPVRGGVEKVMYDLMLGLSERGVDCDILCAETKGPGCVRRINDHARVITTRTWVKAAATMLSPSMLSTLRSIAGDYDVIHVHHPDPMAACALMASGFRGKVVLHWHADILKQKFLLKFYAPLQNWLLRRADAIVGTSPEYLAHSPWLKGVTSKTLCIPIGIHHVRPDEEGARVIRSRYAGKKIVFFLGRLIGYKGVENLVTAAQLLPDDYVVLIGGQGPLFESLAQRIAAEKLSEKVQLLGGIPQNELAAYYTACHVFCLPSVMKTEAFGIVQIEAMSVGRPVVATRIEGSGTAWVNAHGESGMNVDVDDPRGLARAVCHIVGDTARYREFCRGARSRFDQWFNYPTMIDNVQGLYGRLLEEKAPKNSEGSVLH